MVEEVEQEAAREEEESQEPTQHQGNQGEQQWWGTWWQGGSHTTWDEEDAWQQGGKIKTWATRMQEEETTEREDEAAQEEPSPGEEDWVVYVKEYDQQRERSPPEPTREEWLRFEGAWWRKIVSPRPDGADEIWECSDPRLKQQRGRVEGRWLWRDSEKEMWHPLAHPHRPRRHAGRETQRLHRQQELWDRWYQRQANRYHTQRDQHGGASSSWENQGTWHRQNDGWWQQHSETQPAWKQEDPARTGGSGTTRMGEPTRQHNQYEGYRRWGAGSTRVPPRPKNYVPKDDDDDDKAKDGEEEDDDASYVQTNRKKQGGETKGKGKRKEAGKVTPQKKS